MADDTNWAAYGLVERALEDAIVGHEIPWAEVKASALQAISYIDEKMPAATSAD